MKVSIIAAVVVSHIALSVEGAAVAKRSAALPADFDNHPFIRPGPRDDRSPCPGLNTLANHGYLPRDGRAISRDDLDRAFSDGWGIDPSVIKAPKANAFAVCEFNHGKGACPDVFDLSDLNTPHTFEHDHSLSREDFQRLYTSFAVNNHDFNRTIWGDTLSVFGQRNLMSINDAEEIRLTRESLAFQRDPADWFQDARQTMLTEIGFVFAVMRNFEKERRSIAVQSSNKLSDSTVQVDWWSYWFTKERFPTELGWMKPVPDVTNDYVLNIRDTVFGASVSHTPSPLPPDATKSPTARPVVDPNNKREATATTSGQLGVMTGSHGEVLTVPASLVTEAHSRMETVAPSPAPLHPYDVEYSVEDLIAYKSSLSAYQSSYKSMITSLAHDEGITATTPAAALQARETRV